MHIVPLVLVCLDDEAKRFRCKDVEKHFESFPYYNRFQGNDPIMTTTYAIQTVCTMKVIRMVARSVNTTVYLHGGSHLGALIHGGPIPWDDDADMIMDYTKKTAFMQECLHVGKPLRCLNAKFAIKVWLDSPNTYETGYPWRWPFVDLCFFKTNNMYIYETDVNGFLQKHPTPQRYKLTDYFPAKPTYFGGTYFAAPQDKIPTDRYDTTICKIGNWNHRLERPSTPALLHCDKQKKRFPFIYNKTVIYNHFNKTLLPPQIVLN